MKTIVAALALLCVTAEASAAPFCKVDRFGNESCYYYSMQACQNAVANGGGFCIYQREAQPTYSPPAPAAPTYQPPATSGAPFCRVSNAGNENCYYYSLDACQRAAASQGGMCIYNR